MDEKISKKRKLKNDIILAVVIFVLAAAGIMLMNAFKKTGDYVSVKVDGKEIHRYYLNENIDTVIYSGENGEGTNRLVIENGEVYILQADCPDKICVNHKPVKYANERIVCLPNKVVVEIRSYNDSGNVDVVV